MLDNASELIEENIECNVLLDEDRIKERVFQNIRRTHNRQNFWRKKRYAAIFIAVLSISGITVWAYSALKGAGEIRENRGEVMKEQQSQGRDESYVEKIPGQNLEITTELVSPENLYEDGIRIAKYIAEVTVNNTGQIPECYLDNGAMIIFTPSDREGWNMSENGVLELTFQQKRIEDLEEPGTLEAGYIYKGEVFKKDTLKQRENEIELKFSEQGNYALYLKNLSSDRIIILNGMLNKTEDKEK